MAKRLSFEIVKAAFDAKDYILHSTEYISNSEYLFYTCSIHQEKGIQRTTYGRISMDSGCRWCGFEKRTLNQTGSKSHLWKGGKTELPTYLRERLGQWKEDSLKSCSGKCVLSGTSKNLDIHHLYSFNNIVTDTLNELGLSRKPTVSEYTEEELILIENKCLEIHYRFPLGICISKKLHKEFHSIYGRENNTKSQFNEYVSIYYNKTVETKTVEGEKLKYFPYKINATSKYKNVAKNQGRWVSTITYKRKRITIGNFETEYEAAEAYNIKAIELLGINATLNLLDENDKQQKEKRKYFDLKIGSSSKYTGVNYNECGMWVARIDSGEVRLYLGLFQTEWMAAEAFNEKAIELYGEDVILNYITDDDKLKKENYVLKVKIKSSIYFGVTYVKRDKKWNASIVYNNKRLSLGYHILEDDAARAYNNKAIELYGEYAKLNTIIESVAV